MESEEIHLKVNAIHRLRTVLSSMGEESTISLLIPYIDQMILVQEDEVLFAVAEEIGYIFDRIEDKTVFLPTLEALAKHDETVVRE
jgi:serine/threonine-protein phosphatase 2A regulatory subunit A